MLDNLPKGTISMLMKLPALSGVRAQFLADLGIPEEVTRYVGLSRAVRHARHRARARGLGHRPARRWRPTPAAVGPLGAPPRPGPVQGPLVRGRRQRQDRADHRRVERHRPRRRDQDRRGRRDPAARRALARQARGAQDRDRGGRAGPRTCYPADLSDIDAIERLVDRDPARPRRDRRARQQRRPLDPALDRALLRPLPRLRAHDPAQLPGHDQADHRAAPAHARAQGRPRRQRLLDRRADEPAAVLGLRRVEVGAGRVHARRRAPRRSATASRSRRSTCRSCARR